MKKYRIEVTEEQLRLISNCIEDCSRFASGQCRMEHTLEAMAIDMPHETRIDTKFDAEELLNGVKRLLLPNLYDNASLSYNATPFIGNTYQLYRTMLYRLAKDNQRNNVYSFPALPSGIMGDVKIELINE